LGGGGGGGGGGVFFFFLLVFLRAEKRKDVLSFFPPLPLPSPKRRSPLREEKKRKRKGRGGKVGLIPPHYVKRKKDDSILPCSPASPGGEVGADIADRPIFKRKGGVSVLAAPVGRGGKVLSVADRREESRPPSSGRKGRERQLAVDLPGLEGGGRGPACNGAMRGDKKGRKKGTRARPAPNRRPHRKAPLSIRKGEKR